MPAAGRPPLRLALFDCDATLVDGQFAIIDAMTPAWAEHGLGEPDPMEVRRMVGLSLVEAVSLLLPTHVLTGNYIAVSERTLGASCSGSVSSSPTKNFDAMQPPWQAS